MSRHPDGPRPCRVIGHDTRPHRADLGVLANRAKRASSGEVQLDREEQIFVRRVVMNTATPYCLELLKQKHLKKKSEN
tara:strand:- start:168 stop:401 length:234 start_codon:yes stop_codon:yes gene_type:complete